MSRHCLATKLRINPQQSPSNEQQVKLRIGEQGRLRPPLLSGHSAAW